MQDQKDAPWNARWRERRQENIRQIEKLRARLSTMETKSDPRYSRQEPDEQQLHRAS